MTVFKSIKLALLFVSSLFFFLEAHAHSFSVPPDDVNDGDNEPRQSPKVQPEPRFQYPKYSQQSKSPNPPQPPAVRDPYCPGNDNPALMCRLVNQYRAKFGLRPVQLDGAVTREAQYWSDQLNLQNACWFLYHDYNYDARFEPDSRVVDSAKTQRAAVQHATEPNLFCRNGSILQAIAKTC
jgi:Cysteine-rich secretory protein family